VCEYFGLRSKRYTDETADFMRLIFRKSGLGQETFAPPFIFSGKFEKTLAFAIQEAEEGLFAVVSQLLAKSDVHPRDVSVLVVACSMFSPKPSLASMIVRRFKMNDDVKSYSLAGMGCSAGTVGIDMAARALRTQRRPGYALVVVTENTSLNWYFGNNKHMLVTNCIFRVGSAAALITDVPARRADAKYELLRTLRTHHGADDAAYNAAVQMEDEDGMVGVALTKDLVRVAGAGLRQHISTLAPYVLPVSELLRYVPSPYLACCIAANFACLDASPVVSASINGCCAIHRFHFRRFHRLRLHHPPPVAVRGSISALFGCSKRGYRRFVPCSCLPW
jgi:3-ketoacyl-CoA synthase